MSSAQGRKQVLDGETAITLLLQRREGGETKVMLPIGCAHLVTDRHVIEVKHVSKWLEALKVQAYALHLPGRGPRIHLYGMHSESIRQQIIETIEKLGIEISFENASFEKIAATPLGERVED